MSSSPIIQPAVVPGTTTARGDNESDVAFESSHGSPIENLEESGGGGSQEGQEEDSDDAGYIYHPAQEHAEGDEDEDEEDEEEEDEHDDEDDEDDQDYFDGSGGLEFELVIDELAPGADEDEDDDDNDPRTALQRRIRQLIRGRTFTRHDHSLSEILLDRTCKILTLSCRRWWSSLPRFSAIVGAYPRPQHG